MGPDFSKYSDEDLKIAKQHLDVETFPQDAAKLDAEIRRRNGQEEQLPAVKPAIVVAIEKFCDLFGRILHAQRFQIAFVTLLSIMLIVDICATYPVVTLEKTHHYITPIPSYECNTNIYFEDFVAFEEIELILNVDEHTFYAPIASQKECKRLLERIAIRDEIPLWHYEGLIYQLGINGTLLRYDRQVKLSTESRRSVLQLHYFILILMWIGGFLMWGKWE